MSFRQLNFFILFTLALYSCDKNEEEEIIAPSKETSTLHYIHLSHTRTNNNPKIIPELYGYDFRKYAMLFLGGDMAVNTSRDDETMIYLDSIFDFSKKNTLWSLGNHDYYNTNRVKSFTNRNPYYSYNSNGITYVVLDTQDSSSNIVNNQKDFLFNILDTINRSSHLIILHHKLIWLYNNPFIDIDPNSISNGQIGSCFYCLNPNNFFTEIYPKLIDVKRKEINVICLGGDIGKKVTEFEFVTPEGIIFLASGVDKDQVNNQFLSFKHNLDNGTLSWEFLPTYRLNNY